MIRTLKRHTALVAVALVAVVGGGVAYAATSASSDPRTALLNDAAQRLNVTPEQLSAALQGAASDQLDQAVKDGKLTQAQADQMKARLKAHGGVGPFGGFRGGRFGGGPDGPGFGQGRDLKAIAAYLGLTPAKLRAQLESGTTLAGVAKAQGKSLAGLEAAIVAAAQAKLDQAQQDGRITAKQHDALLAQLKAHVGDLVQRTGRGPIGPGGPPPWRDGTGHEPNGPGAPQGPGDWGAPPPPPGG